MNMNLDDFANLEGEVPETRKGDWSVQLAWSRLEMLAPNRPSRRPLGRHKNGTAVEWYHKILD